MRAEDTVRVTVRFEVSETDRANGVRVGDLFKGTVRAEMPKGGSYTLQNVFVQDDELSSWPEATGFLDASKATVAKYSDSDWANITV